MPSFAITRDGVRVAYDMTGRGPPLVMIHGLGDERSLWSPLVERLSPHCCCIALDLRGHGQTTGATDFDVFQLQRDVEAVVSDCGVRRPTVIGHSLGGFVATTYAASAGAKVRAVVNVDQTLLLGPLGAVVSLQRAALQAGEVSPVLMSVLDAIGLGPLESVRARLAQTRAALPKEVVLGIWAPLFEPDTTELQRQVDTVMARVATPYLSLTGAVEDPTYTAWLRERIPHAQLEAWPGSGHFPHLALPDRFAERVRELLAGS